MRDTLEAIGWACLIAVCLNQLKIVDVQQYFNQYGAPLISEQQRANSGTLEGAEQTPEGAKQGTETSQ